MKYPAALIVFVSSLYIGISKAREEKRKVLMLRELCELLEMLKCGICSEKCSICSIFGSEVLNTFRAISGFITAMRSELLHIGEKRLCTIWAECVNKSLHDLPDNALAALLSLGNSLGRYDIELQKSAIERCEAVIQNELSAADKALVNNEKLYIGLGGGAGACLALMLI